MVQAARSGKQNIAEASVASATSKNAVEHDDPFICANAIIGLIKITTYLLSRQLQALEKSFINEGGLRERMTHSRVLQRNKK